MAKTVYKESEWDLKDLLGNKTIDELFEDIKKIADKVESKRKLLRESISSSDFFTIVKELEQLSTITSKLGCYAYLRFCENSSDAKANALKTKIANFLTDIGNRLLFIDLWFKELSDKKANELVKESGKYRYHFEELRKTRKYTLKENEEKIINTKNLNGLSGLINVYDILISQFEFLFEGKLVSQSEVLKHYRDPSPERRKLAYTTLLTKYRQQKDVIGEIYKNVVNDWREEEIKLRKYKDPISVRNISNDIPDKAVEALLNACRKNQNIFHRYFRLKQKKLRLPKITRFDLYAPFSDKKMDVSYNTAVNMVLECFENFSPVFKENALKIIEKNHIHSKIQKNKHLGAFCYGPSVTIHPYVLLNYTDDLREVSTLAHELGHAVHDVLAMGQTEFTFHPSLPLAETASVLSETIMIEALSDRFPTMAEDLLFAKLDDLYQTIIRQATFVDFEIKAHKMFEEGKTIDELGQTYLTMLKEQLGKDVVVDDIFAYEWAYVSHIIHTPFYCYAYAFGNLLALSLYQTYKEQGDKFVPKIIELLSKGGSDSPVNLTKPLGIDITDERFWQKGFDVIKELVDKLENNLK